MLKEVFIRKATSPDGKLRAYVKVITNFDIEINDIKILKINDKYIVGFPAEKKVYEDGSIKFFPIVRIKNKEIRKKFFKRILDEYERQTKGN